jgi:hypothetical protein
MAPSLGPRQIDSRVNYWLEKGAVSFRLRHGLS